ncbi:ABC transporter permease [Streptococcus dentasini]
MLKLINLELKRTNLKPYIISAVLINLFVLAVLHIGGFASENPEIREPGGSPMATPTGFTSFFSVLMIVCFAVLAAVMFGRLVVNEYSGKNASLLFSYPVKRSKVLLAKLVLLAVFIVLSMVIGTTIFLPFFMASNALWHLLSFAVDLAWLGLMLWSILSASLITVAISMVSLCIGLWRNSLPATIVSALVIMAPFTNLLIGALRINPALLFLLAGTSAGVILISYGILVRRLNQREV